MVVSVRMASATVSMPVAIERALALLGPEDRPANPRLKAGYIDLLGDEDPIGSHPGQRVALSRVLPRIYERLWRPIVLRRIAGRKAPRWREERQMAVRMLALSSGHRVLDIGCGTGNFTRVFAEVVNGGLTVGLDASPTMLAAAVRRTQAANVAYVRADGGVLPFRASSFESVCCFGALHLFAEPMRALSEIVRVLAPGGRVGLLTTCELPSKSGGADSPGRSVNGMLIFGPDEITGVLREHGLLDVEQRVMRMAQFVSARKPAA